MDQGSFKNVCSHLYSKTKFTVHAQLLAEKTESIGVQLKSTKMDNIKMANGGFATLTATSILQVDSSQFYYIS